MTKLSINEVLDGINKLRYAAIDRNLYGNKEYGQLAYDIQHTAAYYSRLDQEDVYGAAYSAASQALLLLRKSASDDALHDRVIEYADMAIEALESQLTNAHHP